MSEFLIRKAIIDDLETLAQIGAATFLESYIEEIDGQAMITHCAHEHSVSAYRAYLAAPKTVCWLAVYRATRAPVGYAMITTPDLPVEIETEDIELKRIYVLSRFHRRGIATALLDQGLETARAAGAHRLLLGTYEDNHRATAFYKRHGFQTIGTRQFNVGGKLYDDIVMAKSLLSGT